MLSLPVGKNGTALLPALLIGTAGAPAATKVQTDWLCQAKNWQSTSIMRSWFRNKNDSEDIFRLRIINSTTIRITGSTIFRNGNRSVSKRGSKYIFTDRQSYTNQFGLSYFPTGEAYFDADNGQISSETIGPKIVGIQYYYLAFGECE